MIPHAQDEPVFTVSLAEFVNFVLMLREGRVIMGACAFHWNRSEDDYHARNDVGFMRGAGLTEEQISAAHRYGSAVFTYRSTP